MTARPWRRGASARQGWMWWREGCGEFCVSTLTMAGLDPAIQLGGRLNFACGENSLKFSSCLSLSKDEERAKIYFIPSRARAAAPLLAFGSKPLRQAQGEVIVLSIRSDPFP